MPCATPSTYNRENYVKLATALLVATFGTALAFENGQPAETRVGALSTFKANGQGATSSKPFQLEQGLAVFQIETNGKSPFSVELIDAATGKTASNLVNENGAFRGTLASGIRQSGEYLLKIAGDGAWNISVGQPKPVEIVKPGDIVGQGYDVSEFVDLNEGLAVFEFTHPGDGPFSVWMLDSNGKPVEHLLDVRGKYHGTKPTTIDTPGAYLFNVESNGAWSVKIEQ